MNIKQRTGKTSTAFITAVAVCAAFLSSASPSHQTLSNSNVETIDYPALFKALAYVESTDGKRSSNVYQISWSFIYDLRRITGESWDYKKVTRSRAISEQAMRIYWSYYTSRYLATPGHKVTPELLAKMHNVGYIGLKTKKSQADRYWSKVKPVYEKFRRNQR